MYLNPEDSELYALLSAMVEELAESPLRPSEATCIVIELDVGQGSLEISVAEPADLTEEALQAALTGAGDADDVMAIGDWRLASSKWDLCPVFANRWQAEWKPKISDCCELLLDLGFDQQRAQFKDSILRLLALYGVELEARPSLSKLGRPSIIVVDVDESVKSALERYLHVKGDGTLR